MKKFEYIKSLIDKYISREAGQRLDRNYRVLFSYIEQCLERGLIDICEEIILLDYMDAVYKKATAPVKKVIIVM
jgi:fructose-bisphosphate aldolase class 1